MATLQDSTIFKRLLATAAIISFFFTLLRLHIDQLPVRSDRRTRSDVIDSIPEILDDSRLGITILPGQISKSKIRSLDIVVSLYNEDLSKTAALLSDLKALKPVRGLDITVYAYTKDAAADVEVIKNALETPHVSILQNAGREAGTYYTHIIDHWDDLARHTLFMQADIHGYEAARNKIVDYFRPNTGLLPLGVIESCSSTSCSDPWDPSRTFPRLPELYSALHGSFCPPRIALSYQGQMIVSASRIRARSKGTYAYLKSVLESEPEHFIHQDPRQPNFADEKSNPYFGHTLERSWMVLWDCADDAIAIRCGGAAGLGSRRTEGLEDDTCQCLDDPSKAKEPHFAGLKSQRIFH